VEFIVEADHLDRNDMVCDFKVMKEAVEDFVMSFDHSLCMNTEDPQYSAMREAYGDRVIGFPGKDPTTEVLAKALHDEFRKRLAVYARNADAVYPLSEAVHIVRVRLWETGSSWAEYYE
jgi:6-pyruvoyltetrahydropterin/6-carboxytetrahydropterin synthase